MQNVLIAALKGARGAGPAVLMPQGAPDPDARALWQQAAKAAAALQGMGVQPGDRVAVQAAKSLAMFEIYLGCVMAGAVFLPLNPDYTATEVGYFLSDATPALLVCDPAKAARLVPLAGQAVVRTLGAEGQGSMAQAVAAAGPLPAPVPRSGGDLAAILYTSGTTGRSKGAMLTHDNLVSNARTLMAEWRFTAADTLIHALPLFHTHGLFVAAHVALMAGAAMILHPRFDPAAVLADMPRATVLMGVPTFYTRLLDQPGLEAASRGMRLFVSGSAPLLAETHRAWAARTGHQILERYGMTETNMNTSNPYDGPRKPGTVGRPLPGVEVIVADAAGVPLPLGEIGTVEVRGPNVFKGYWNMPDKTREELRPNGFFITGDLGSFDAEGYLTIIGRSKDLIISGGYNVYPKEVEGLIDALPGVVESAVFGAPHADLGEGVVAAVVPVKGVALRAEDILAALAPDLARFKRPRCVLIVPSLPRNTMGKVQKVQLRKDHAGVFAQP